MTEPTEPQPESPTWLSDLSSHHITFLFKDPEQELPADLAQRLAGYGAIYQVGWTSSLDTDKRWRLSPSDIEALKDLRRWLDERWSELPEAAREAIKAHNTSRRPLDGRYRDDVETLDDWGMTSGGRDLRGSFHLSEVLRGYVRLAP
jgi:hypothetical protein